MKDFSRWFLGVHSIRIFAKNMGDPYYEPTIVVHDKDTFGLASTSQGTMKVLWASFWLIFFCEKVQIFLIQLLPYCKIGLMKCLQNITYFGKMIIFSL